jgi:nucleoside-diphosphate-sugar epimerase
MVTGAAGFIGSHLAERLLRDGHFVRAVDSLTPYYAGGLKRANLSALQGHPEFEVILEDLRSCDLARALVNIDVVFHQAGQPGVRSSWSTEFDSYVSHNVVATQRLLEAVVHSDVKRFVFASSSSIYGNAAVYPTTEEQTPAPFSPYGVTKLAAEHLCRVYAENWGIPSVALRYFSVYGPRQRPDMAIHRMIDAGFTGRSFPVFGDGLQIRDYTYVEDVVRANLLAAEVRTPAATVVNIAGGTQASVLDLVEAVGELLDRPIRIEWRNAEAGDVRRTAGATDRALALFGWRPRVDLREGLARHVAWYRRAFRSRARSSRDGD